MKNTQAIIDFVQQRIRELHGLESVSLAPDGAINVIIKNGIDRRLREDVLEIGKRALVPIRVFYRMPDGRAIGEEQVRAEGIEDYYTPIHVPGFAGAASEAPPEEVAKEVDGAQKLKRVRDTSRGRPVVAWKLGNTSVRRGAEVRFKKQVALQWTVGRTLNVQPGATGRVVDLSTKRPIAYLELGGYDGIELPIQMLGHAFELVTQPRQADESRGWNNWMGYMTPEHKRMMLSVGFGEVPGEGDGSKPWNTPNFSPLGYDRAEPSIPSSSGSSDEEDMLADPQTADPAQADQRFDGPVGKNDTKQKKLVLGRR